MLPVEVAVCIHYSRPPNIMYNIYFLPYCVLDMHCVTIKKPSFHALGASDARRPLPRRLRRGPKYGRSVTTNNTEPRRHGARGGAESSLFTIRLIALNKNIEL